MRVSRALCEGAAVRRRGPCPALQVRVLGPPSAQQGRYGRERSNARDQRGGVASIQRQGGLQSTQFCGAVKLGGNRITAAGPSWLRPAALAPAALAAPPHTRLHLHGIAVWRPPGMALQQPPWMQRASPAGMPVRRQPTVWGADQSPSPPPAPSNRAPAPSAVPALPPIMRVGRARCPTTPSLRYCTLGVRIWRRARVDLLLLPGQRHATPAGHSGRAPRADPLRAQIWAVGSRALAHRAGAGGTEGARACCTRILTSGAPTRARPGRSSGATARRWRAANGEVTIRAGWGRRRASWAPPIHTTHRIETCSANEAIRLWPKTRQRLGLGKSWHTRRARQLAAQLHAATGSGLQSGERPVDASVHSRRVGGAEESGPTTGGSH